MISAHRLRVILAEHDVDPPISRITDAQFRCPTRRWLWDDFAPAWRAYADAMGLRYSPERQDCDDFAFHAISYARQLHARTRGSDDTALAFGYYEYVMADTMTKHAINVAVVGTTSGNFEPVWFDAQQSAVVALDRVERQTCAFYLF